MTAHSGYVTVESVWKNREERFTECRRKDSLPQLPKGSPITRDAISNFTESLEDGHLAFDGVMAMLVHQIIKQPCSITIEPRADLFRDEQVVCHGHHQSSAETRQ